MSRIGKQPITVPSTVTVEMAEQVLSAKGPKGTNTVKLHPKVKVEQQDNTLTVRPADNSRLARSLWGLTRTLIDNAIVGVDKGFTKTLEFTGVGYRAAVTGRDLTLNLGFSHPIQVKPSETIAFAADRTSITVSGPNKDEVGQFAATIRKFRPPEPYKGKGLRYQGERIRRKAGKSGKAK